MSDTTKRKRCPNGTRRNKNTGECVQSAIKMTNLGHKPKTKKSRPMDYYIEIVHYRRGTSIFNIRGREVWSKPFAEVIEIIRLTEDDVYDHAPVRNKLYYFYPDDVHITKNILGTTYFATKTSAYKYLKEHRKAMVAEHGHLFGLMGIDWSHKAPGPVLI